MGDVSCDIFILETVWGWKFLLSNVCGNSLELDIVTNNCTVSINAMHYREVEEKKLMNMMIFRRLCGVSLSPSSPSFSPSLYFPHSDLFSAPGDCVLSCHLLVRYFKIFHTFRISAHRDMLILIKYHHLCFCTSVRFRIPVQKNM